jgi:hypothetical protein
MRSRHKLAPPLGPSPACVTQSCFKAFLELFPALLLRVCAALYSRKVMLYRCHSLIMLAHCLQIPVHRGQSFRRIADSIPVIADSF